LHVPVRINAPKKKSKQNEKNGLQEKPVKAIIFHSGCCL